MNGEIPFIGRAPERERLGEALARAGGGAGSLVLVSGEAGVGKTRLMGELTAGPDGLALRGRAVQAGTAPYGPVVAALRAHLRTDPAALDGAGPLRAHLALILPELGRPAPGGDRATLVEAVRLALAGMGRNRTVLLLLDDLQWSDEATLELLGSLADPLASMPVLAVAAYRSEALGREHPLRRLRNDLRRAGRLHELHLDPLDPSEATALLGAVLGAAPSPALARAIHDRAAGSPFFVAELARALCAAGAVSAGPDGLALAPDGPVPVPETIRDAVLMTAAELSPAARAAAEVASVAGESFDLGAVAAVAGAEGLAELADRGLVAEDGRGGGTFRHALTREAFYADVPWLRRRELHRRLAEALVSGGARSAEVAVHWLRARDDARARDALIRAAEDSRAVHAHRDAARAGRQALDLWPADHDREGRLATLRAYAGSAELCGELAEAARAWREVCAIAEACGAPARLGWALRRLAAVHDLTGDREAGLAARRDAAEAFAAAGREPEAAVERLVIADVLSYAGRHSAAIDLAARAGAEATVAGRADLRARALGVSGSARARRGDIAGGRRDVEAGLALAVEHGMRSATAELHQRLGVVLYNSADYRAAEAPLDTALGLCRTGDEALEWTCLVCLAYVLRERGEWRRATALCERLIATGVEPWIAEGLLGAMLAHQGRTASARRRLERCLRGADHADFLVMAVDSRAALAAIAAAAGDDAGAAALCRAILARWRQSEDHHYSIRGLRWSAAFAARHGDRETAHGCAAALGRIAAEAGHADALAALAHAIGESALADGDAATAAAQFRRALEIHRGLDMPLERAEIAVRAGDALAAAGDRRAAAAALRDAHRTARRLGARPLAAEAARALAALGVPLGRRAAADADGAGLSRREVEVVRLVAAGRTNREIADALVLSPRTVDMHVRNLLRKLDSRSRTEAARRATELGLTA